MSASKLIDKQIAELPDWRGKTIAKLRKIIHEADPEIAEEWKWNTAVFSHNGLVVAVGAFKGNVKMNFFQGASLPDPRRLLNAGLEQARVIRMMPTSRYVAHPSGSLVSGQAPRK